MNEEKKGKTLEFIYSGGDSPRLDVFLADSIGDQSRSFLQKLIKKGKVTVDGEETKASHSLKEGEKITVDLPPPPPEIPIAQDIPLEVLYEDEHIVVIDKPAGMVVHPGSGNPDGTLVNALRNTVEKLSQVGEAYRMGIVHRLDKDTSGVILVAKTNRAHRHIAAQFKERRVKKEYLAITEGVPPYKEDVIDAPLGRSERDRRKMSIRRDERAKSAQTRYQVVKSWGKLALVKAFPKTGRTHQIRVHLQSIQAPVLCDEFYSHRRELKASDIGLNSEEVLLSRQALHAHRLEISLFGETMEFTAPLADDLKGLIEIFEGKV